MANAESRNPEQREVVILRRELERLWVIIKNAPHEAACKFKRYAAMNDQSPWPCNCWKSRIGAPWASTEESHG